MDRHPRQSFVLDHVAKPRIAEGILEPWAEQIRELARRPNVVCKVSVVVHSDTDPPCEAEALAPFLRHAISAFGWERVLFGSNWPVSTTVIGYRDWVELLGAALPAGSEAELGAFYAGNARRLYRLD